VVWTSLKCVCVCVCVCVYEYTVYEKRPTFDLLLLRACETTIRLGLGKKANLIIVNNQQQRMTNGNSYLQAI